VNWTTYAYDALGRTTRVTLADGSHTDYLYVGNTVRVTNAAGKWKTHTMDALGNLVTVTELTSSSVVITINTQNWKIGNTLYKAELHLHELGHAYDIIHGSGNSVIKSPDDAPGFIPIIGGDKRSKWNFWKIDQDCFGGEYGSKKP
jgi:hypothetical protein